MGFDAVSSWNQLNPEVFSQGKGRGDHRPSPHHTVTPPTSIQPLLPSILSLSLPTCSSMLGTSTHLSHPPPFPSLPFPPLPSPPIQTPATASTEQSFLERWLPGWSSGYSLSGASKEGAGLTSRSPGDKVQPSLQKQQSIKEGSSVSVCQFVCIRRLSCMYCMFACNLSVCMYVCLYVCMFVCLYVCMSICLYACLSVLIHQLSVCIISLPAMCVCVVSPHRPLSFQTIRLCRG